MKKRHLTLAATLCAASMVFPGGPANASLSADDGHSDGAGTWGSLLETPPTKEHTPSSGPAKSGMHATPAGSPAVR